MNRDGVIKIHGFEASLLYKQFELSQEEIKEAFFLLCNEEQEFQYQTWICSRYPHLQQSFTIQISARETTLVGDSMIQIESTVEQSGGWGQNKSNQALESSGFN